ncbi:putative LRR receptor-like serine/threonine-protein kinase [Panicum miliaceum]|uniref:LRR receptor-like serine/threonine-protein kinase n=1 Tax=Panicum miliaceum TaxID=4540 RepID=A0A3L6Q3I1_PANMI|nr:putative LRR receptor-like serine/threonine-protein kinase [Panicum miliaceum]
MTKPFVLTLGVLLVMSCGAGSVSRATLGGEDGADLHSLLGFKRAITNDPRGALSAWNASAHFCLWNGVTGVSRARSQNCSTLRTLNLSRNFLVGRIPAEIGRLSNLTSLSLRFNNLIGIIPPELCNATSLKELRLTYNKLGGSIPEGFGKLTELRTLSLAVNRISGGVPESLFNLSLLQLLSLTGNRLHGQLPPEIGNAFPDLQFLDLATNMFCN